MMLNISPELVGTMKVLLELKQRDYAMEAIRAKEMVEAAYWGEASARYGRLRFELERAWAARGGR